MEKRLEKIIYFLDLDKCPQGLIPKSVRNTNGYAYSYCVPLRKKDDPDFLGVWGTPVYFDAQDMGLYEGQGFEVSVDVKTLGEEQLKYLCSETIPEALLCEKTKVS